MSERVTRIAKVELADSPVDRARSIVSFTDHLPRAIKSGLFFPVGNASSRLPASECIPFSAIVLLDIVFFASALFSAICSRMLSDGTLGVGGSSCKGFAGRLAGDFGTDEVADRRLFTLACVRRVVWDRFDGVGLGAGFLVEGVEVPTRKLAVDAFFTGVVRVVLRDGVREDDEGGGTRDIAVRNTHCYRPLLNDVIWVSGNEPNQRIHA